MRRAIPAKVIFIGARKLAESEFLCELCGRKLCEICGNCPSCEGHEFECETETSRRWANYHSQ
jgi:hypothetical protein